MDIQESYEREKLMKLAGKHGISPTILFSMRTNQVKWELFSMLIGKMIR